MLTAGYPTGQAVPKPTVTSPSGIVDITSLKEFSDMAVEMHRVMSFTAWPNKDIFPLPSALASAGFYHTGEGDKTRCFSCKGEVCNWKPNMYPDVIHRTRFPHCRLVKGEEVRHKPMQSSPEVYDKVETYFRKKSNDLPFISRNTNIVKQPSNPHGMTNPILVNLRRPQSASRSPAISLEALSPLSTLLNSSGDMSFEQERLRSFAHWPKSDMIRPSDLARAGMYFIGPGDRVQCAFCKGKLEGWIRGDSPLDEHKKHFGARCRFMQGAQVGNVPIVRGDNPPVSLPPAISNRSFSQIFRPRFPEYADVQRRLQSFCNWIPVTPTPCDLATAGFFYKNDGDTVKCYSCGGTLNDWQPNDDPWLEHAHWFPHCTHLIQVKGPEFVEDVIRNYGELVRAHDRQRQRQSSITGPCEGNPPMREFPSPRSGTESRRAPNAAVTDSRSVTTAPAPGWSADVIMASEVAKSVLELGLLRVDVERAARVWASRNNGRMPDANSLAELAMSIKDGHDLSSPSGDSAPTTSTPPASNVTSPSTRRVDNPQATNGSQPAPKSKRSKKKKKNKGKSDPVAQTLTKHAATNSTLEEEEEISLDKQAAQLFCEFSKLQEQWQCKVCMDETINMVFMPCGHTECCSLCAPALTKCPVCRSAIGDTVRIYLP